MSKSGDLRREIKLKKDEFIGFCKKELERIEKAKTLPEEYKGFTRPNNNSDRQAIIDVFKHVIKNNGFFDDLSENGKKRIGTKQSKLKITYQLIVNEGGNIFLFFDPNSKFNDEPWLDLFKLDSSPKKKICGKGGQSKVRYSFAFIKGKIFPTVTLVSLDSVDIKQLNSEYQQLQSSLGYNPFIIKYYYGENYLNKRDNTDKLAFFSPRKDTNLEKYLKKCKKSQDLPLSHTLWSMYSLISGLDYLHSKNILHRDIKPQNVLVEIKKYGPLFQIGDLGLIRYQDKITENTEFSGSSDYLGFDNHYFQQLIKEVLHTKFENGGSLSEQQFVDIVNRSKFDGTPLFDSKLSKAADRFQTKIIWKKIQRGEHIDCTKTYANVKEDVTQLLVTIMQIIVKFKKLNNNILPDILNKFYLHIKEQLELPRSERQNIKEFKDYFLKEINTFIGNDHPYSERSEIYQSFKNQTKILKIENPITSIPHEQIEEKNTETSKTHKVTQLELKIAPEETKIIPVTVTPETKNHDLIPQSKPIHLSEIFSNLILLIKDEYWDGKTTYGFSVADGIGKMRFRIQTTEGMSIEQRFQSFQEVARNQLKVNACSFLVKRNPQVALFYNVLEKCNTLTELSTNKDFKRLLDNREKIAGHRFEVRNMMCGDF